MFSVRGQTSGKYSFFNLSRAILRSSFVSILHVRKRIRTFIPRLERYVMMQLYFQYLSRLWRDKQNVVEPVSICRSQVHVWKRVWHLESPTAYKTRAEVPSPVWSVRLFTIESILYLKLPQTLICILLNVKRYSRIKCGIHKCTRTVYEKHVSQTMTSVNLSYVWKANIIILLSFKLARTLQIFLGFVSRFLGFLARNQCSLKLNK